MQPREESNPECSSIWGRRGVRASKSQTRRSNFRRAFSLVHRMAGFPRIDQDGYAELINSVKIQGKILPTEANNQRAAIRVEGGSLFWVAANDVSISGTIIPNDGTNSSGNNGQNRKPVNELFKQ